MSQRRIPIEVFSLSFLDVIACAFGAVVMLILLAKGGDEDFFNTEEMIATLQRGIAQAGRDNETLKAELETAAGSASESQKASARATRELAKLQGEVEQSKTVLAKLLIEAKKEQSKRKPPQQVVASTREGQETTRDEEVGGIPVDSEYVIFVVDTSGSMKRIWSLVMSTLTEVLNNHPKVKGFQVITDNGIYLQRATKGRWLKDTPQTRAQVLGQMRTWSGSSSSSPVEGIQEALRRYGPARGSLALYVFGDDFTGASFDRALRGINGLNTSGGKKLARIHAVAFNSNSGPREMLKFSQLMREVTLQNNGTFMTTN